MHAFAGRRSGYSNAALLVAMAVLLCIALLSQISSGALSLDGLLAKPGVAAAKGGKAKTAKQPPMIPAVTWPAIALATPETPPAVPDDSRSFTELRQAIVHMDGRAAARMLAELDTPTIVELLIGQRERDLARILEEADPVNAAQWTAALVAESDRRRLAAAAAALAEQSPPAVPGEPTAADGTEAPAGADGSNPNIEQPPPVDGTSGAVADVPAENGSSGTGTALPLPPGTNIA